MPDTYEDSYINEITKLQKAKVEEIKQCHSDIATLNSALDIYCRTKDICPECYGKGEIFIDSHSDDPNFRSSDDMHTCPVCEGHGNYVKKYNKRGKE